MDRKRFGLIVIAAIAVALAAVLWWRNQGGAGDKGTTAGGGADDVVAPPELKQSPQSLAPKPLQPSTPSKAPSPSPRKRALTLGVGGGTLSVVGRAVDDAGRPIAKPVVEVVVPDGLFAETVGEDDGTFAVPVFLLYGRGQLHAFVEARATDGRVARKEFVIRADPRFDRESWRQKEAVGDLVLRAAIDVDVLVVSPTGAPVAAEVTAASADARWAVARVIATTGKDGRGRLVGLTPEPHRLIAVAHGFGRGVVTTTPGAADASPVRIALVPARRIDVAVVEQGTQKPVARAEVEVLGIAEPKSETGFVRLLPPIALVATDKSGHAAIEDLGEGDDVALTARDEAAAAQQDGMAHDDYGATLVTRGRSFVVVPHGETSVTLMLSLKRTIEWPIEAGEESVPPDGTAIRIENPAGSGRPSSEVPTEGQVEHGHLVVEGCRTRNFHALARTPDGAIATIYAAPEQAVGPPIRFQRGRRVEVILKNADGTPGAGLRVQFRQEGNNPVGEPITTDAEGRAVLEGQEGHSRSAWLVEGEEEWEGMPLGSATIREGDARIEATIPALREAIVRVKADAPIDLEQVGVYAGGAVATIVEREPARSELRIRFRPRTVFQEGAAVMRRPHVGVEAAGFLPADSEVPDGALPVVEVELHSAASVGVVLKPPAQAYLIMLQRYDESARRWRTVAEASVGGRYAFQISAGGRGRISQIESGRYRWVDARSGTLSEPFDAAPGANVERTLDLSNAAIVRGRVEVPAGESAAGVGILRLGADPDIPGWQMNSGRRSAAITDAAGKFELRVPGGSPVRLAIERGRFAPAPDGGEVDVTGARDDVVLRAVRGSAAVVRFDKELRADMGAMRVLLFQGEPAGEPAFETRATIEGTRLRFSGFAPGRYTLWIDSSPYAPTVLRGVDLRDGDNDLGKATASDGTTIVLKVLTKPGAAAPDLQFSASPVVEPGGAPSYFRTTFSHKGEARLKGLGAGRVGVSTFASGEPRGVHKQLDVDGTGEVTVELDLR